MLIKAAINGGRTKAEHPSIPVTPDEQAVAVVESLAAGGSAIHLHVRSASGGESLHGTELTTWTVMQDAIKNGYDIRIGFEDTLLLPDGSVAPTNAELVLEAKRQVSRGGVV